MPPEQDDKMNTPPEKSNANATTSTNDNELKGIFPKPKADETKTSTTMHPVNASSPTATAAAAAVALDPQEVFNASIEFQSTFEAPIPRRSPLEFVRSSSSRASLYPSLASLSQSDASVDLERNWEAASRSSMKKRASTASTTTPKMKSVVANDSEFKVPSSSSLRRKSDRVETNNDWTSSSSVASVRTSQVAAMPFASGAEPAVAWASIPSETKADDNDLIAAKLAAYSGGSLEMSASLKRAAYKYGSGRQAWRNAAGASSSIARLPPEQHAEATFIDYDVHPSDISVNAVQAEYVAPLSETGSTSSKATASSIPPTSAVAGLDSADTEATVLESGPMSLANAEPWWGAAPAAEATVLRDDGMHQDMVDLDCKPPARDSRYNGAQAGHQAEATIIGYEVHPAELASDAIQAEFVGQDYQADTDPVGASDEAIMPAEASQVTSLSSSATYHVNGAEIGDDQDEHVTEVAVIESGPMDKATMEAWSATTSGEAQVLEEAPYSHISPFDSKPSPDVDQESWRTESHGDSGQFAMMEGEAEVVMITEEVHPSELLETSAAQAELVGSDFNTAIAVPSGGAEQNDMHNSTGTTGEIIVQSCEEDTEYHNSSITPPSESQPQEAQATLVNDGECYHHGEVHTTPAVAVIDSFASSGRAISEPLPATPVTVLEECPAVPPRVSFNDPVKQEPYSGRTVSAPPSVEVVHESLDTSHLIAQDEWTRVPSFGGDSESTPAPIPPPMATATEIFGTEPVPPPIPSPQTMTQGSSSNRSRVKSNASSTSDSSVPGLQMISSNIARGANNVMETLFGNGMPGCRRPQALDGVDLDKMSGSVLPRTLLPSSVIYSEPTDSWVATVNTNQKALEANDVEESSKALRAFSVPSKKQAAALALAWAPPQMHPFGSNPVCFICEAPFAVFRRACHCRNCGVCVCSACSVQWPAKMLPDTYNIKKESSVSICKACDWLCSEFRLALLQGNHDKAVALHSTGNINLTTPFANVKGELFYPVHCAVLGGNLRLLKWLVDDHCCPLRSIRISNGKVKGSSGSYTPILTSKGRSLLGIALGNRNIGIGRYLVVEKRMLLSAEKGLSVETLTQNLDLVLRVLPEEILDEQVLRRHSARPSIGFSDKTESMSDNAEISAIGGAGELDEEARGLAESECIICFDNHINCVFTPCGHQICCLDCGNHISRCPVCAVECSPMRVFKP